MIPYYTLPKIPGLPIKPFGVLVYLGTILGYLWCLRRAKQYAVPAQRITSIVVWVVFPAFYLSHVLQVVMYFPHKITEDPMSLLTMKGGISSFGGLMSFAVLAVIYYRVVKPPENAYVLGDIFTQGFLLAWIFGRFGCAMAHDHPGIASDFFLAVQYPDFPKHDLGVYEFLYTVLVMVPISIWIHHRKFKPGMQLVVFSLIYAPFRLLGDALRTADARYFGWTPGQYCSVILFLFGLWLLGKVKRQAVAVAETTT